MATGFVLLHSGQTGVRGDMRRFREEDAFGVMGAVVGKAVANVAMVGNENRENENVGYRKVDLKEML